jgi:hypothetical protein
MENNEIILIKKKFNSNIDVLNYLYHCKYFKINETTQIQFNNINWFPNNITDASLIAKSWTASLKQRNKLFKKYNIQILFNFDSNYIIIDINLKL